MQQTAAVVLHNIKSHFRSCNNFHCTVAHLLSIEILQCILPQSTCRLGNQSIYLSLALNRMFSSSSYSSSSGWSRLADFLPIGDLQVQSLWNEDNFVSEMNPDLSYSVKVDEPFGAHILTINTACTHYSVQPAILLYEVLSHANRKPPKFKNFTLGIVGKLLNIHTSSRKFFITFLHYFSL